MKLVGKDGEAVEGFHNLLRVEWAMERRKCLLPFADDPCRASAAPGKFEAERFSERHRNHRDICSPGKLFRLAL
jgi:hypothetical protein